MLNQIYGDELAGLLHSFGGEIEVLSLDCFDTLLWRTSPDPSDLFCELPAPLTRSTRFVAEKTARQQRFVAAGHREVTLADIYRCAVPGAEPGEIAGYVAAELALEHRHCLAFAPAVALIRNAKRRGLKVIVVSDTYLTTDELSALIADKLGAEAFAQIDHVFASSAFGAGKLTGLFPIVLERLGVEPQRVLHVGDNPSADLKCALQAGVQAVHLLQGDEALEEQWRLEQAALVTAKPELRQSAMPLLPHRPHLAQQLRRHDTPAGRLGYGTLGPLMYGFANWVRAQARELAQGGRSVKVCFLMRDGYLPKRAYEAIATADDPPSHAIELSRFAAWSASLRDAGDVIAYTGSQWNSNRLEAIARQLLFKTVEIDALLQRVGTEPNAVHALTTEALRPHNIKKIVNRSAVERRSMLAYLRRQLDPRPGEVLLLVDTGSVGTVQNRVQDIIAEAFGVEVHGRYMLLLDVPRAAERKCGFFGPDRVDARLLRALCNYTSVVEQLCTVAQGSCVGYTDRGEPRRQDAEFSAPQIDKRSKVQDACLQFIGNVPSASASEAGRSLHAAWLGALAAYARLLFLPLADDLAFLEDFVHDVNMGGKETVQLLDAAQAREDLLRIGPMYVKSSLRVFGPGELRKHGLDLALQLLMRRRLDIDLRSTDFRRDALQLPVMVARGQESTIVQIEALPTHDGYYSASVPIGRCEYAIGVLFGQLFEWVQLESARVTSVRRQFDTFMRHREVDLTASAMHEHTRCEAGGLLHCTQEHSFSFFAPQPVAGDPDGHYVLRVVFRPLAWRRAEVNSAANVAAALTATA